MKKLFAAFSFIVMSSFFCVQANAFFEGRLTYGFLAGNADLAPLCPTCSGSAPSIVPMYGLGVDAILTLPVPVPYFPGIGLRYENMSLTTSANGMDFDGSFSRTALILNWRIIDTLLYLGPILTYGISHTTSMKVTQSGVTKADFSAGSPSSYSIGVEGGVKLIGFEVGAEAGYMDFHWNSSSDSSGNAATQDINMSGPYAKLVLGFSI